MKGQRSETIICSMCGYEFDPSRMPICQGCPLQKGCQLACCPNCGFENVDIKRSTLVRLTTKVFGLMKDEASTEGNETSNQEED